VGAWRSGSLVVCECGGIVGTVVVLVDFFF
jgi:hypothetical protein